MSSGIKQVFRRMNLDSDVRSLKHGEYRRLYNGSPVQPRSSSNLDDVIASISGNAVVTNADLGAGTNKVIGFLEDRAGNRAFYFIYNATASLQTIYQYKAGVVTRLMRTALFAWASTDFIDADINGEILTFTNNATEIRKINVTKALAGSYPGGLQEEDITLIKRPGTLPLGLSEVAGAGRYNYSGYQFYYRYVYEDGDASVWSATSKIYSTTTPNTVLAVILRITFPAGETVPDMVAQREFAFRLANTQEFIIYRTEKVGSFSAYHDFTDELVGETVPDSQSFKWYDVIPLTCKALRWFRTRLFLANYPVNYDKTTTLSGVTALSASDSTVIVWSTVPAWDVATNYTGVEYVLSGGKVWLSLRASLGVTPVAGLDWAQQPAQGVGDNGNYVFERNSKYRFGIIFHDWAARHVGVYTDPNLDMAIGDTEFISDIGSGVLGYKGKVVSYDLTSLTAANIPTWATHYQWVRTKNLTKSFFIDNFAPDAYFYKKDADGVITYAKTNFQNFDGLAIDLSNLIKQNIGYTFQAGDRVRLYTSAAGTPFVWEKNIEEQTGKFILVKGGNVGVTLTAGAADLFYIEIYTPYKTGPIVEEWYEIGEKYAISNAGTGSRDFSQLTGVIRGDCYIISRKAYTYSGGYSATLPYGNGLLGTATTFYIHAMNPSDLFFTDWITDVGRATLQLPVVALQQRTNYIKFGQPFVQGATIQAFNTFEALDDYALPIKSGAVTGLADAGGQVLEAIHEIESTALYIGQGFINTTDANQFLAKTDNVIGDDRKYNDGFGCVNQSTIVSRNSRVYYLDFRKGVIVRRSQDGLTAISDNGVIALVSNLCIAHAALGANSRIIAGWDPQYDCYVISFIDTSGGTGYTLYWHEETKSWLCLTDYRPEFWGQLGQYQLSFLAGALWSQTVDANYNKFFGVQYNRRLEFEIGADSSEKIWEAIEADIESPYTTAGNNEDVLLLYHTNGGTLQNRINYLDWKLRGSAYRSSLFGNLNDANFSTTTESKYKSRHNTRGQSAFLVITYNGTAKNVMKSITVFFRQSMNTTP